MSDGKGMKDKMGMLTVAAFVGFCLGAGLANHCNHHRGTGNADTIRVTVDTIRDNAPKAKDSVVVGTIALPFVPSLPREGSDMANPTVPKAEVKVFPPSELDSIMGMTGGDASRPWDGGKIGGSDTVWATVPRVQKRYEDSTYTAWVSGYEPRLDSIEVYGKTVTIVRREEGRVKNRRLAFGLTGGFGYGVFTRKPDLFVGVGASWRLFP